MCPGGNFVGQFFCGAILRGNSEIFFSDIFTCIFSLFSVFLSVCLFVCLSVTLSVCLSVCLSLSLCLCLCLSLATLVVFVIVVVVMVLVVVVNPQKEQNKYSMTMCKPDIAGLEPEWSRMPRTRRFLRDLGAEALRKSLQRGRRSQGRMQQC